MEIVIPTLIVTLLLSLFFVPLYWTVVIEDNSLHNRWNDYKIKEIDCRGEKYYAAYVYCGKFFFKKIYLPYNAYVYYPIKSFDTGKCKLFYSENDLVNVLNDKYEDDLKNDKLNKMI